MNPGLSPAPARPLPGDGPRLAVRRRDQRDLGRVVLQPDSPDLIAGVEIAAGALWPDDRGFFSELFRFDAASGGGWTRGFAACVQVSAALSHPGVIKAMHYHRRQTDLWAPVQGQFQVVLLDLRVEAASFGAVITMYLGEWRPWRLRIPPGVAHGYKVVGTEAALMVYATDRFYDPSDEGRIAHDDPGFNYDWELQHK
ncbi:MAG: dTDP-4-dehydrorhamnose 3,5-epimerase family protein [Terriglobales bacterium]